MAEGRGCYLTLGPTPKSHIFYFIFGKLEYTKFLIWQSIVKPFTWALMVPASP
jgi:hypothetical protein